MSFGLPYCGSKNKIASWVVEAIAPEGSLFSTRKEYECFVDVFFGGGAISHYLLENKRSRFKRIIANDILPMPSLFESIMKGKVDLTKYTQITREEFMRNKALPIQEQDQIIALCYSFGNNRTDYMYSIEDSKKPLPECYIDKATGYFALPKTKCSRKNYEHIERLNRLIDIQQLAKKRNLPEFIAKQGDYRNLEIPKGSLVYLDPPYQDSYSLAYYDKRKSTFDMDELYRWATYLTDKLGCDVFMSERQAPSIFELVAKRDYILGFGETGKKFQSVECVYKLKERQQRKEIER